MPEEINKSHDGDSVVTLEVAGAGESKQDTRPEAADEWTPDDTIEPPEDLNLLVKLTAENPTRRGIIEAIALNTVGLGHDVIPREGHEHGLAEHEGPRAIELLDALAERDRILDNPGFAEQLMAVKHDEESCGQGYLEISRNKLTGQIDGFYHLPGHLVRRKKDRSGWVMGRRDQLLAGERKEFYNYGEKVKYDADGKALPKLQKPGKQRWAVNEILRFRIYSSESRDYGLPRDVALAVDYAGDKMAAEDNVTALDNSGTPPGILFVEGVETESGGRITFRVPEKTVERITATMRSGKRGDRVAVVPLPPGANANFVPLVSGETSDLAHGDYRRDVQNRQLSSFRISPIFISANSEGRYGAEVERSITLEQVFDPEQRRYERRIDRLLRDLGYRDYRFSFKRLAVEGDAAQAEHAEMLAESGNLTVGEHRKAHGYPPYREAEKGKQPDEEAGEKPYGFNSLLLVELGEDDPIEPPAPRERTPASEDNRGLEPGVGGRKRKRPPGDQAHVSEPLSRKAIGKGSLSARRRIEKCGGDASDLPEYVMAAAAQLAEDLRLGSTGREGE
ncbi:MAG TPA: phage portal protein [Solirubrobacterales bacterium]